MKKLVLKILHTFGLFRLVQAAYLRLRFLQDYLNEELFNPTKLSSKVLQQVETSSRNSPNNESLCVFASFDKDSLIDDYVVYYLQALKEQLHADIIFVTTSELLTAEEINKISPFCRKIIQRQNNGADFGSWKVGLSGISGWEEKYNQIFFCNDSCYGPIRNMQSFQQQLQSELPIMAGVTLSQQIRPHIQSYFIGFNKAAISSGFISNFFENLRFYNSKYLIVYRYESGISNAAKNFGIEWRVLFGPKDFKSELSVNKAFNPTFDGWRQLVEDPRSFLVKVDLLRRNPAQIQGLNQAVELISKSTDYPAAMIRKHLKRVGSAIEL